jgi:iron(III) transport system ATP-binding protein
VSITFSNVSHAYDGLPVLHDVDLEVRTGEVLALLGPSGSGKSTLLKLAAGLEPLQAGSIALPGMKVVPAACPAPEKRPTCLVFQQHALFPHLTVAENVAFGLGGLEPEARQARVREALAAAGLEGLERRYPHTLSGGQQQRVALARALAPQPAVMLMDEPFASVDALLAHRLREEARATLQASGATTLLVTHDPEDALALADRIAVIVDGRIVQVGTPQELWSHPAHPFVAEVFARRQLLEARSDGSALQTAFGPIRDVPLPANAGDVVYLAIDPFAVEVIADSSGPARVRDVRFAGRSHVLHLQSVEGEAQLNVSCMARPPVATGDRVRLGFAPEGVAVYT